MSASEIKVTGRVLTFSKSTLARNQEIFRAGGGDDRGRVLAAGQHDEKSSSATHTAGPTSQPACPAKRIRQDGKPLMNKLESEWFAIVKDRYPNFPPVRAQAKTFRLCNGVRYTPDFSCSIWPVEGAAARETCWEVKGVHAWEDSIIKLKMAAHEYPEICWKLVWKENGIWQQQEILS